MKCAALVLLSIGALASCENVSVQHEEIWVRHDAAADRIDFLYLYDGVSAVGGMAGAKAQVEALLDGERRFGMSWLFSFDLEDTDQVELTVDDEELLAGITVEEAYAYRNEDGELALAQHVRARNAGRLVARLNERIREWAALLMEEQTESDDDLERRLAWKKATEEGWEFLRFEGPQLTVQFPLTAKEAADLQAELARAAEAPHHPLADVTASSIEAGRATLTYGTKDAKAWSVPQENESREYDPALLEALAEDGREVRDNVRFDEVLAKFLAD